MHIENDERRKSGAVEEWEFALILGYGRSGQAAEKLLKREKVKTFVCAEEAGRSDPLCEILAQQHFDVCIVSPGFPMDHPWLCAVRAKDIPLLSELELGWSYHKGRTIAVTGSNGKSSAVKWIADSLAEAGSSVAIGGNYGIPACEVVLKKDDHEWLVLEVSSFQLETVRFFSPEIAVVLNVLPNHLDRHGSMDAYLRTKAQIFEHAVYRIVPFELASRFKSVAGDCGDWETFGAASESDFTYAAGEIIHHGRAVMDLSGTLFGSPILGSCTGAAVAAVMQCSGKDFSMAEKAAKCFEPLPHRLQVLGEINGVQFVNDSKATNLAAVAAAMQSCGDKIRLIAGGLPKESDYTFVKEILAKRVRSIYLVGQASQAMYEAWNGVCSCTECGTLEAAVEGAAHSAEPGDTVLLSPGCASFDQFLSFEERGETFEKLFNGLKNASLGAPLE